MALRSDVMGSCSMCGSKLANDGLLAPLGHVRVTPQGCVLFDIVIAPPAGERQVIDRTPSGHISREVSLRKRPSRS